MKKDSYVIFESINVNIIDTNSGIFVGENMQINWNSNTKSVSGISLNGESNWAVGNVDLIVKSDF
ncbi:hypothetical protein [Halalkalibacter akibai]|uniref:Uncharacterized protein n=1 Tax=Halalkalibacter akibai (strain ATCC 43226 / DSM 21942 / CIP 109018 / JCM 9157 / 1139) TaxID=1236973 RepID=W4QYZ8_HALA3|nr:hypothetical protein [Halalkalibacter akibai]GAE37370.1 hypothetical protein JCM9157_4645 [Halalkalibacter akibai JCM 9157]